jgi:hypothetical protein
MTIVDAINSAASEHAVYFLVTAYIESLRHFRRGLEIPESVVRLPLSGVGDLEERLTCLQTSVRPPLESVVPASEVCAVLTSAVQRLSNDRPQVREKR